MRFRFSTHRIYISATLMCWTRISPDIGGAQCMTAFIQFRAFVTGGKHSLYPLIAPRIFLCIPHSFRPEFLPFFGPEVILPEMVDLMIEIWLELILTPYWKVRKVFHFLLLWDTIKFCHPQPDKIAIRPLLILRP